MRLFDFLRQTSSTIIGRPEHIAFVSTSPHVAAECITEPVGGMAQLLRLIHSSR